MIGAIAGDIIGSIYEFSSIKREDFPLFGHNSTFTDDTVLTVAIADSILNNKDYGQTLKEYGRKYPGRCYGGMFRVWLDSEAFHPYNSFGNGSAMRVSPVGFAFDTLERVLAEARKSAEATHSHPEGIKGAQVVAAAIFLARQGESKAVIKKYIEEMFAYRLAQPLDDLRLNYSFNGTCQGTVPQAIIAFLASSDYEDAIRKAISLGGDADTLACIVGGIAEAYYRDIPNHIESESVKRLSPDLVKIISSFNEVFNL
jgi:ADP-ribosylglycohydrolase